MSDVRAEIRDAVYAVVADEITGGNSWQIALSRRIGDAAYAAARLDVDRLRRAIYVVSERHDWAHSVDTEDRTEEIAAEYALDD